MVKLLTSESKENIMVPLATLISLKDVDFPGGDIAVRELDTEHLETLILSDPKRWPAIVVTSTDQGLLIIDGNHRKEASVAKGLTEIKAVARNYASETDVVEACFRANLTHGLKASAETRSDYAYWLHITYPDMDQKEIAARAILNQSSVSRAISRREARKTETETSPNEATTQSEETEEQNEKPLDIVKSYQSFARKAVKLFDDLDDYEEADLIKMLSSSIKKADDRAKIARVGQLLVDISKPHKKKRP